MMFSDLPSSHGGEVMIKIRSPVGFGSVWKMAWVFLNYSSRRTLNWWMWSSQYLITSMGRLLGTQRVGRSWRNWLEKFEGDWDWRLGDQTGGHLVTWFWSDVSLASVVTRGIRKVVKLMERKEWGIENLRGQLLKQQGIHVEMSYGQ